MPILESYPADEDDLDLDSTPAPERPQRIPVPPIMLWGAMWLMAISVTVAATATLLLPRQLNAPPRPYPPSPADVSNPPELPTPATETETNAPADAEASEVLPPPPAETAPQPSEPKIEPPPTAVSRFPLRLLLGVMGGCAITSVTVTLILRGATQRPRRQREPREPTTRHQSTVSYRSRTRPTVANHLTQPTVMVLPPEMVTPLDGIPAEDEGDLAAQLDIRRRYSLSSLMEDSLD
ncbi:MAG: hypothetical protein F6J87_17430 [Spirulina sp. SIO3F2]|nr:hypothetical protein [Spirulina sp. SIO3F2]